MLARLAWPRLLDMIGQREVYPGWVNQASMFEQVMAILIHLRRFFFLMSKTSMVCRLKHSITRIHYSS